MLISPPNNESKLLKRISDNIIEFVCGYATCDTCGDVQILLVGRVHKTEIVIGVEVGGGAGGPVLLVIIHSSDNIRIVCELHAHLIFLYGLTATMATKNAQSVIRPYITQVTLFLI